MTMKHTGRMSITLGRTMWRVEPKPGDPDYVAPPDHTEALDRMKYEADTAKAEAARVKKELDEIKKQLPSEEQRARYAELEQQAQSAAEEAAKKKGDFDAWRQQILDKHAKDLDAERQMALNASAKQSATEAELNETLIGREFADASDLFGPTGKTVLMPAVAQAYFAPYVSVEIVASANGGPARRRVVVKDIHGAVIVDTKSGQPLVFAKAMAELVDMLPQKEHMLRGSGRVGSNSPGGINGVDGQLDTSRLKSKDFSDPKVREAVRNQMANSGGLQMGPAFDRMKKSK